MLVRIVRGYRSERDLMRQTPGGGGEWSGIVFTLDPVPECDYLVVLSYPQRPFDLRVARSNIWLVAQEPPDSYHRPLHRPGKVFSRVFTSDPSLEGGRYVHSQPALPWHIERTLDQLRSTEPPEKTRDLSWVTSSLAKLPGHRVRMDFLQRLQGEIDFDLYGRGFNPIVDKWEALAPYRYSIAIENFSNGWYWTEKLADCFLSWTVPIYFGCTRVNEYFPAASVIQFDPADPDAIEKIGRVIAEDDWGRRLDALAEARRRVLERYQLFPFLAAQIAAHRSVLGGATPEEVHVSSRHTVRDSLAVRLQAFRARRDRSRADGITTL